MFLERTSILQTPLLISKTIMVTSHGEEKLVLEAIVNGAKGYILKPINQAKLKSVIDKLFLNIKR